MLTKYLEIAPEIQKALANNQPIVALESTIISHGMPYPKNVETALQVEQTVRDEGAIPATIAILGGKLKAGLTREDITHLGKKGTDVIKTSRRDILFLLARGLDGATTVASTMIIAELAGIPIFATGGIGGVHRGATSSLDISADLQELANTPVAVVCAGAKSILDLGLTLEYLETFGVTVVGFQTKEFPAFFSRKSGFGVDYSVDSAGELAKALRIKWDLGLKGGILVANPIPEEFELEYSFINQTIETAIAEAEKQGIEGKEITPFLLSKIEELTQGKSLEANIKLVLNNATLAAQLAKAFAGMRC